jgi:hypothetical protein
LQLQHGILSVNGVEYLVVVLRQQAPSFDPYQLRVVGDHHHGLVGRFCGACWFGQGRHSGFILFALRIQTQLLSKRRFFLGRLLGRSGLGRLALGLL